MIGTNIRNARKFKALSINRLSELAGISLGYLSDIENNKRRPSLNMLEKIAEALEVSVSELLGSDEKTTLEESKPQHDSKIKPIIDSLDRAGDLQDEDIDEIARQVEFLINLKKKKK